MSFLIPNLFMELIYIYHENRHIQSSYSWEHIFRILFRIESIKKTNREMSSIEMYARVRWRVKVTWKTRVYIVQKAYLVLLRYATKFRICLNRQKLKMFLYFLFFSFLFTRNMINKIDIGFHSILSQPIHRFVK